MALNENPFVEWIIEMIHTSKWSIDACVGYARVNNLFPKELIVSTNTIYNAVWNGNIQLSTLDLPEALKRKKSKHHSRKNKKSFGASIDEGPEEVSKRTNTGH